MAKVIITVEDAPNGMIKATAEPTWETLVAKHKSGHGLSSAEAYALRSHANYKEYSRQEQANRLKDQNNLWMPEERKRTIIDI